MELPHIFMMTARIIYTDKPDVVLTLLDRSDKKSINTLHPQNFIHLWFTLLQMLQIQDYNRFSPVKRIRPGLYNTERNFLQFIPLRKHSFLTPFIRVIPKHTIRF